MKKMIGVTFMAIVLTISASAAEKTGNPAELLGERVKFAKGSIQPPRGWEKSKRGAGLASFDFPNTKLLFAGMAVFRWDEKPTDFKTAVTELANTYVQQDKATLAKKEDVQVDGVKGLMMSFSVPKGSYVSVEAVRVAVLLENGVKLWFNLPADQYQNHAAAIKASIESYKKE